MITGIRDSSLVAQLIVLILIGASIVSWGVILYKMRWFRRNERDVAKFRSQFDHLGGNLDALHEQTISWKQNPAATLFQSCYREIHLLAPREANVAVIRGEVVEGVERASERTINETEMHLEKGLSLLTMTASTCPLLGLLGTVWGILEVFQAIDRSSTPSIGEIAPGISAALITTIFGLIAAIPAAAAYNLFLVRLNRMLSTLENLAGQITNILVRHQIRQTRSTGESRR
ncbi:MAG: MotA/TolQ/ExbB proton channel family protein [Candidatus Omnitrophica bacterium]|nr:MotA/TolQ/ExbB proton channel family protein [Candidatus Omnitrophota bacterium]MCA9416221.1 MotA/TolQ/ExbB proton channel family protein [Candidatus Omnitrophota bacterium]MCA9425483.1 MotA/TolQ/ExbB proton channel family protein [Candidatus Omnitrophota bacterium]MCA9431171.1 MotA/TolQ/ExbB proton channel family protein [Candidatus Omnitrophota bacterium]MCA9435317.1 MotA/TolQ/ExbB proton channel family protein [Candidatus Omnitrophota bacterium]